MRLLARFLEKDNYSVYAPIFSGHDTDEPKDILVHGSPERWWQDTQIAIDYVRSQGYSQIAIFGLSLGGIFATQALESDSQLLGGGTFSAPIIGTGKSNVADSFPVMAQARYQQQRTDRVIEQQNIMWIKKNLPAQLQAVNGYTKKVAQQLSQITQPFFIGQGGQDEMIDAQAGQLLQQQLTSLNKITDFHLYPNAGHVITVNNAHHELEQDVKNYLKKIF